MARQLARQLRRLARQLSYKITGGRHRCYESSQDIVVLESFSCARRREGVATERRHVNREVATRRSPKVLPRGSRSKALRVVCALSEAIAHCAAPPQRIGGSHGQKSARANIGELAST